MIPRRSLILILTRTRTTQHTLIHTHIEKLTLSLSRSLIVRVDRNSMGHARIFFEYTKEGETTDFSREPLRKYERRGPLKRNINLI